MTGDQETVALGDGQGDETEFEHPDRGKTLKPVELREVEISRLSNGSPLGVMLFVTAEDLHKIGIDPSQPSVSVAIWKGGLILR